MSEAVGADSQGKDTTHLNEALDLCANGYYVFPGVKGEKRPMPGIQWGDESTNDPGKIREWWAHKWPDANIWINCGQSGIVVFDFDRKLIQKDGNVLYDGRTGMDSYQTLSDMYPEILETRKVRTGSGGIHLYFKNRGLHIASKNGQLSAYPGVDVKAHGGAVIAPPSLSDKGNYSCEDRRDAADLPGCLEDLLRQEGFIDDGNNPDDGCAGATAAYARSVNPEFFVDKYANKAQTGNRNDVGLQLAMQLRDLGLSLQEAKPHMLEYQSRVPQQGAAYTVSETLATLDSAYSHPAREPAIISCMPGDAVSLNDVANAERLLSKHGIDLRHVKKWKKWFFWDGTRWKTEATGEVHRKAMDIAKGLFREISSIDDFQRQSTFARFAVRSNSAYSIDSMVSLASYMEPIAVNPDHFDGDSCMVNVANCTLNLRTGESHDHKREDFITRIAGTNYDPAAKCERWLAFLEQILPDPDTRKTLQMAIGYCLTGDINEQCMFILYGSGQNGKSTLVQTIAAILGDYAKAVAPETFMERRNEGVRNDLAALQGARFVHTAEPKEGQRLDESLVKLVTGGEPIVARYLYGEFFEFQPQFKVFYSTNHKPIIQGTDHGIWRRLRMIPFTVRIPEDKRDPHLPGKLLEERAGILNWMLEGCKMRQQEGCIFLSAEVKNATKVYREDMDVTGEFLSSCCIDDPTASEYFADLYMAYEGWCGANNERPITTKKFSLRLQERGYNRRKASQGRAVFDGIRIIREPKTSGDAGGESSSPPTLLPAQSG